jgi:hypothetical protein
VIYQGDGLPIGGRDRFAPILPPPLKRKKRQKSTPFCLLQVGITAHGSKERSTKEIDLILGFATMGLKYPLRRSWNIHA